MNLHHKFAIVSITSFTKVSTFHFDVLIAYPLCKLFERNFKPYLDDIDKN